MIAYSLRDGGLILKYDEFSPTAHADRWLQTFQDEIAWEQKPGLFGHLQPRLIATHGDPGVSYRYSGRDYPAMPWTATLLEIKQAIEQTRPGDLGDVTWNYCLLNRYRDGRDSMGWHADDEPEIGPVIASVSLGATRSFQIRHTTTRETQRFDLTHGSLLIMAGTMQQFWMHQIPKTKKPVGERINLTFRMIMRN
jgi:alkylated DNA repair dioxygenase AlkB